MRFARVEDFMKNKPNFGMIADEAMKARSKEKTNSYNAAGHVEAANIQAEGRLAAAKTQAGAIEFAGMMGGLESVISGGLRGLKKVDKSSGYTNNPGAKISDPTADIQRALGPGVKFGMY